MPVILITDPINTIYGGVQPPHFENLRAAGIQVVMTDLKKLRDSNPFYSAWWRMGPRWLGHPKPGGRLPNPFNPEGPSVGIRSWLSLLNFKANHRKVLLSDDGHGHWGIIVGSLNAHDGSSRHSNLAVEITSTAVARQVWESESAVSAMSGTPLRPNPIPAAVPPPANPGPGCEVNLLTEGAIRDAILNELNQSGRGDSIDGTFFYLSHRGIRKALIGAATRGARIRLILDPSKDDFVRTKSGIPNRLAAPDLMTHGLGRITVRWYETHGEQFHPKAFVFRNTVTTTIILGSANLTRRNLDNFNLESNVRIRCPDGSPPEAALQQWFDTLWFNEGITQRLNMVDSRMTPRSVKSSPQSKSEPVWERSDAIHRMNCICFTSQSGGALFLPLSRKVTPNRPRGIISNQIRTSAATASVMIPTVKRTAIKPRARP